ncbi:MAG: SAM-dependent methyltransferase [Kibdelosporangium sp.]
MARHRAARSQDAELGGPKMARMYDYALGGGHNLGSDRELIDQLSTIRPDIQKSIWDNRAFLRRAVLFMIESGIRQFLDLGAGIPTAGNVHEIAQKSEPDARVVYVDRDSLAVNQFSLLLAGNPLATVVEADIRQPGPIFADPGTNRLLDLAEPVGVLALCVAHFLTDSEVDTAFTGLRDLVPAGSMLAISHVTEDFPEAKVAEVLEAARQAGSEMVHSRSKDQIRRLFGDFPLVEPGIVAPAGWRPDKRFPPGASPEDDGALWAGVAIKS